VNQQTTRRFQVGDTVRVIRVTDAGGISDQVGVVYEITPDPSVGLWMHVNTEPYQDDAGNTVSTTSARLHEDHTPRFGNTVRLLQPAPNPAAQAAAWAASCEALNAASATERLAALQAAVEATVHDLDRAGLLPADYECVPDTNVGELRILTGNLQLRAGMTGSLDTPAAHFLVTTSDDDDEQAATERTTTDLGAVRAWIMRWSVTALIGSEGGL
jgi:hypothetical protein